MNKNIYKMSDDERKMIESVVNNGNRVTIIPVKNGAKYFQENRKEIKPKKFDVTSEKR